MLRRLKRIVRVGAFGLAILLLVGAVVWLYSDIKWGRALKAEIAALKDEGIPLRLEDITRSPVPDEQNAATLYQKVFQVRFARVDLRDAFAPPGMAGLSRDELHILGRYVQAPQNADVAKCRELLRRPEVQEALDIFQRASRRPECVFPVRWQDGFDMAFGSAFPHLEKAQSAAVIVAAWALLLASEQRIDEALDWCATGLRMCTHFASEPSAPARKQSHRMLLVVGAALTRVLCDTDVSPSEARRFDEHLRRLDAVQRAACRATLSQSVAILGGYYEDLHERPASAYPLVHAIVLISTWMAQDSDAPVLPQIGAWIYCSRLARPLHKLDHLRFLRWMHAIVSLSKLPYRETAAAHQSLDEEMTAASSGASWIPNGLQLVFPVAILVDPACLMCNEYGDLTLTRDVTGAEIGLLRVALALKAHKYEHGSYPSDLYSLQSGLQEQLPEDPFSGKRFVYQRQAEGFKLYSIGQDLMDSGGQPGEERRYHYNYPDRDFDIIWQCAK